MRVWLIKSDMPLTNDQNRRFAVGKNFPFSCPSIKLKSEQSMDSFTKDILSNYKLETMVDTTDEWITTRTGIKERRILKGEDLGTSDMAETAL